MNGRSQQSADLSIFADFLRSCIEEPHNKAKFLEVVSPFISNEAKQYFKVIMEVKSIEDIGYLLIPNDYAIIARLIYAETK